MPLFDLLIDACLAAACLALAIGCVILDRRLRRLQSTEAGIGKAVADMAQSVVRLQQARVETENAAREATNHLDRRIKDAMLLAERLDRLARVVSRAVSGDPLADIVPKGFDAAPYKRQDEVARRRSDAAAHPRGTSGSEPPARAPGSGRAAA